MNRTSLSLLEKVDLRDVWVSEAQDFTPWLAEEKNLNLLAGTLNLDLILEASERSVGPFRADILCKEMNTDHWVLIENQLETSDHVHLGQILTYAAGLDARTVIWIAKKFTEEHRAALDRLNSMSSSNGIHFFAVEIELWKIGNSQPAPKFNVVVQPNGWSSQVAEASRTIELEELSDTRQLQFEYWEQFNDSLKNHRTIRPQKAYPRAWARFPVGRGGMQLAATVNSIEEFIGVELYLGGSEAKQQFHELMTQKEEIESEIGPGVEWKELPERTACRIILRLKDADFSRKDDWGRQHTWLMNNLAAFKRAFGSRIKGLGLREAS